MEISRRTALVVLGGAALAPRSSAAQTDEESTDATGYDVGAYGAGGYASQIRLCLYVDDDGVVDTDGLREAVDDWRTGDVDTELLREVVDLWRTGSIVQECD